MWALQNDVGIWAQLVCLRKAAYSPANRMKSSEKEDGIGANGLTCYKLEGLSYKLFFVGHDYDHVAVERKKG